MKIPDDVMSVDNVEQFRKRAEEGKDCETLYVLRRVQNFSDAKKDNTSLRSSKSGISRKRDHPSSGFSSSPQQAKQRRV
jgi:hypothetical protein